MQLAIENGIKEIDPKNTEINPAVINFKDF
jgi:hypothetical protein